MDQRKAQGFGPAIRPGTPFCSLLKQKAGACWRAPPCWRYLPRKLGRPALAALRLLTHWGRSGFTGRARDAHLAGRLRSRRSRVQVSPPLQSSACNLRRGATPELPARTRGYLISGANDHWFVGSWASFSIRAIRPPHFPALPALLCGSTQPAFSVSGRVILQLPGCWCVVVCSCHPACPLVLLSEIHCLKSCGFAAGWGLSV